VKTESDISRPSPLWVISGHWSDSTQCLLYPQSRRRNVKHAKSLWKPASPLGEDVPGHGWRAACRGSSRRRHDGRHSLSQALIDTHDRV